MKIRNQAAVLCFILFASGLLLGFIPGGMSLGQNKMPDPNAVAAKQPTVPTTRPAKHSLTGFLLAVSPDWLSYYDTMPPDLLQIYYNLSKFLDVLRLQTARINDLTARVIALENKGAIDPNIVKPK